MPAGYAHPGRSDYACPGWSPLSTPRRPRPAARPCRMPHAAYDRTLAWPLSAWQAANPTTGWQESGLKPASCPGLAGPDRTLAERLEQRSDTHAQSYGCGSASSPAPPAGMRCRAHPSDLSTNLGRGAAVAWMRRVGAVRLPALALHPRTGVPRPAPVAAPSGGGATMSRGAGNAWAVRWQAGAAPIPCDVSGALGLCRL